MDVVFSELLNNKIEGVTYENNTLYFNNDLSLKIDFDIKMDEVNIVVNKGNISLIEINPNYEKINVSVKQDASFKHCSLLMKNETFEKSKLYCENYGTYNRFLIDLCNRSNTLDATIELKGEGSESNYKSSIVSPYKSIKKHVIHVVNDARHTIGNILNYGIVFGNSTLDITGIGDIKQGASYSEAHQKSTVVTFDEGSKGYARPFLYIGDDEVQASHDTSVGKISDDILFYMCSRGIPENVARRYIAIGYFKPIIEALEDEKTQKVIIDYLEGAIKLC